MVIHTLIGTKTSRINLSLIMLILIGSAILYEVKKYDNKAQFLKDRNKHHANVNFFDYYMYDFKVKNVK
jgi:hypothetical protein